MVLLSLLSLYQVIHHLLCLNMTKVNTSTNWSLSCPCIAREKLDSDMLEAQHSAIILGVQWKWSRYGYGTIVPSIQTTTGFYSTLMSNNYNDNDDVA